MPIQEGKYVTPAWQNGGAPAITAEELTAIGQSIEQDQTNITENTQNIESNTESINTLDQWKTDRDPLIQGALQKSGGTMTGGLILNADPTQNLQAATKQYVDNNFINKIEFVEQVSVYMSDATSNTYSFNPAFASLSNGYECMIVTVSGDVNTNGGTLSLFGQIGLRGEIGTNIPHSSPAFYLFTKYGPGYNSPTRDINVRYAGLVAETGNNGDNLLVTATPDGQPDTYKVSLSDPNSTGSTYVNILIKFYGWNPI